MCVTFLLLGRSGYKPGECGNVPFHLISPFLSAIFYLLLQIRSSASDVREVSTVWEGLLFGKGWLEV